ncbi:hypothetical protein Tco_1334552 [Tanacetum coccineum]
MAMAAARGGGDGDEGGDDEVKVMRVVYGGEWVVRGAAMVRQRRCGCWRGWAARGLVSQVDPGRSDMELFLCWLEKFPRRQRIFGGGVVVAGGGGAAGIFGREMSL